MKRIQRQRTKGWRMPPNTVYVGWPSRWGNPYLLTDVGRRFPSLTADQCAGFVVNEFRDLLGAHAPAFLLEVHKPRSLTDSLPSRTPGAEREKRTATYPSIVEIRRELAGKDLVCWCPLDKPCHADILLELANRDTP